VSMISKAQVKALAGGDAWLENCENASNHDPLPNVVYGIDLSS
jgi:hypothetical protein